jgi:N utilization substance protein B
MSSGASSAIAKNKAARLMAVQAVYQMAVNNKPAPMVIDEYVRLRKGMEIGGEVMIEPDESLFRDIVLGVAERHGDLAAIVEANRTVKEGHTRPDEPLLMAHFLCGSYELLSHQSIDSSIIISTYVDVAKAFFEGAEPGLVNGVLDSVRKTVRT